MNITIIGAGNVGYHLSQRLVEVGHRIQQIFSRKTDKVIRISKIIKAEPIDNLSSVKKGADLYILAVKDDAIGSVAEKIRKKIPGNSWVVHTSGSTPSTVLEPYFENYGVFYPLQTFSMNRMAEFTDIPFLVDANKELMKERLYSLAETISPKVYRIDDEARAKIHVSAVFVNNFTNHLYAIAEDMLRSEELPIEVISPLIQETAKKIRFHSPQTVQTGPAVRGDEATIQRHLEYLEKFPKYKEVYELLTGSIGGMYGS